MRNHWLGVLTGPVNGSKDIWPEAQLDNYGHHMESVVCYHHDSLYMGMVVVDSLQ